jgi:hypothetical protein
MAKEEPANLADLKYTGRVPDTLGDGRPIEPGEVLKDVDLDDPHNSRLKSDGLLIDAEPEVDPDAEPALTGDDLKKRAEELDIPDRSKMNADQLRQAVAEREQEGADS